MDYFELNFNVANLNLENPIGSGGNIATAFAILVLHCRKSFKIPTSKSIKGYNPKDLFLELQKFSARFVEGQQNDAHVLVNTLLEAIHEDLNEVRTKPYQDLFSNE